MQLRLLTKKQFFHTLIIISTFFVFASALAAEYWFSKEAILESFHTSLTSVGAIISASDQMLIARMLRREAWDWHFVAGVILGISFFSMIALSLISKTGLYGQKKKYYVYFGISLIPLFITGILMYSRIYIPMEKDVFLVLKQIHNFFMIVFIFTFLYHIFDVWYNKLYFTFGGKDV